MNRARCQRPRTARTTQAIKHSAITKIDIAAVATIPACTVGMLPASRARSPPPGSNERADRDQRAAPPAITARGTPPLRAAVSSARTRRNTTENNASPAHSPRPMNQRRLLTWRWWHGAPAPPSQNQPPAGEEGEDIEDGGAFPSQPRSCSGSPRENLWPQRGHGAQHAAKCWICGSP